MKCAFRGRSFARATFAAFEAPDCVFLDADMEAACFREARLIGADCSRAKLPG
jgi:hypothetical protein